jgi:hypothetical protein
VPLTHLTEIVALQAYHFNLPEIAALDAAVINAPTGTALLAMQLISLKQLCFITLFFSFVAYLEPACSLVWSFGSALAQNSQEDFEAGISRIKFALL